MDDNQGHRIVVLTRDCVGCGHVHASVVVNRDDTHDVDECPRCGREVNPVARVWCRPTNASGHSDSEAVHALFARSNQPMWQKQETRVLEHGVTKIVLRSDAGVVAEVLLDSDEGLSSRRAIAMFRGDDAYSAWIACVRAHADVMRAFADRASRGDPPHLSDVGLTTSPPAPGILLSRLNLYGRSAWTLLSAAFGDALAEVTP